MELRSPKTADNQLSRSVAAEDLRCGEFVAILHEIVEWPSFFWCGADPQLLPPEEPVRLLTRSSQAGMPLKVKAISLPFVFVKQPCGGHLTLDVRQHRLARLSDEYAREVWKAMEKQRARISRSWLLAPDSWP